LLSAENVEDAEVLRTASPRSRRLRRARRT